MELVKFFTLTACLCVSAFCPLLGGPLFLLCGALGLVNVDL